MSEEALYHRSCFVKVMRTFPTSKPVGLTTEWATLLTELCNWLDLYTIADVHAKMMELADGVAV